MTVPILKFLFSVLSEKCMWQVYDLIAHCVYEYRQFSEPPAYVAL